MDFQQHDVATDIITLQSQITELHSACWGNGVRRGGKETESWQKME